MIVLAFVAIILWLVLWFWNDKKNYGKCPPGPLRLPILGNLLQLARISEFPGVDFSKLAKIYGDVIYVRMGFTNVVVFNSPESIQQIRANELCQVRGYEMVPALANRNNGKNLGLIFANGNVQSALRSFTVRKLRDFGLGKSAPMDNLINEEMKIFSDILNSQFGDNGEAVIDNMGDLLFVSIARIVNRYTTGTKYEYNDRKIRKLLKLSHDVIQSFNLGMSTAIAFPFLYDWFPTWFGKKEQTGTFRNLMDFFREVVDDRRAEAGYTLYSNTFLDEFLNKIDHDNGENDTPFTDEQLVMCLLDLFQAGSDATSSTVNFALVYMMIHQNIQKKVQQEIDENICNNELIGYDTRRKLPYTYATFLECTRYGSVVPTSIPHLASEDFYYKGFLIKKGTYLIMNRYGIHHSEKIWGDPHTFRPERFLKEDGTVDINKEKMLMPFGRGKRICLAMSLGESAAFIYFATLLRKFIFKKVCEADCLSIVPTLGIVQAARPYRAKVIARVITN